MSITLARPIQSNTELEAQSGRSRLTYLDGIRAVAALWVVISHIWISQFGLQAHAGALGFFSNWLLYSHFAVDIFIVVSGYCLALPVLRSRGLKNGVLDFYLRRARRILPPCYVALAFSVGIATVGHRLDHGTWYVNGRAILANILLLQDAMLKWDIYNGPLWSVAVEWRIYFLFPILIFLLFRIGRVAALAAASVVGYGATALIMHAYPTMLLTCPWYLALFAMGICAATTKTNWAALPGPGVFAAISVIVALGIVHVHPVTISGGSDFGLHMFLIDTFVGGATALLLVKLYSDLQQTDRRGLLSVLSWKPLVRLGEISYSLYLVHMPIILVMLRLLRLPILTILEAPAERLGLLLLVGLPLILGLSVLFYGAFERPFMRRGAV